MFVENKKNGFYTFNFWHIFFVYALLYAMLTYLGNEYIYNETFYSTAFHGTLDPDRIADTINMRQRFQWMGYLIQPLMLLLRCGLYAASIFTGLYVLDLKLSFNACLRIVIIADIVVFVVNLVRTLHFMSVPPASFADLQYYYPLSISQLLHIEKIPSFYRYPLQQINLFEIGYWLLLVLGIRSFIGLRWGRSFSIVACTYGVASLLWIMTVVFISLQMN